MVDKLIIRAIYEDGVFKPLEPVSLRDKQVVKFEVQLDTPQPIEDFKGILAPYWNDGDATVDDLDEMLRAEHKKSLYRLLNQIEGNDLS